MADLNTDIPGAQEPDRYRGLSGSATAERRIRRSRFLARASPAADEGAARLVIAELSRLHHDARHVCHAWRLGPPPAPSENRNDDGEPSGTAGEPILAALRKEAISDAVVVVARWFGGVKLGTGGLARAYGEAATAAILAAPKREIRLGAEFRLDFAYSWRRTLEHLLRAHGGDLLHEDYGAAVTWRVWLPRSQCAACAAAITAASAGRIALRPAG